jgi:putative nucleotidyltransferase with HDIG domain
MDTLHLHEIPFFSELRHKFFELCSSFTLAMQAKDVVLYKHSLRVQSLVLAFTTTVLHLPEAEAMTIGLAALFHDLGKMNISETLLHKASGLTRQEFERMQAHPAYGAHVLNQFKLTQRVVPLVYHHHERLDGKGHPDGIRGAAIPVGARIIAIGDAFEVMTFHRIYQKSRTAHQACEELYEHAGTQFDAELVELFCTSFNLHLLDTIHVPWTSGSVFF